MCGGKISRILEGENVKFSTFIYIVTSINTLPEYRMITRIPTYLLCLLAFWLVSATSFAANKVFTGPGSFSDPSKWNFGTLPAAGDQIRINGTCIFDYPLGTAFNNLTVGHSVPGTLVWPAGSTNVLNVNNVAATIPGSAINMTNGGVLMVRNSWVTTNMTFTPGTGTVIWNVTNANSSLPTTILTYNNLTILAAPRTVTLAATTTVSRDLTIISGVLSTSTFGLNIGGNFTNNATFTAGTAAVTMNGTIAQNIGGTTSTSFTSLTIVNTTSTVAASTSFSVSTTLTINANAILVPAAGVIVSGAGTLTGSGTARVTRTAATADFLTQYTITGKVLTNLIVDYAGSGNQTVNTLNYGSLTISATVARTVTFPSAIVGVGLAFTPDVSITSYIIAGNTINFNGTAAQIIPAFNYNNLTSSSTGARTLSSTGIIGIAGVFTPGTNAYTITGSTVNFNSASAQTIPVFNYFNLTSSSTGGRVLSPLGTIGIAGTFTPGTNTYTNTGSTIDFNGTGAQTIPAFSYNNLTSSSTGVRTLASSGTIFISGVFTPGTNAYTVSGSTVNFSGTGSQTIPAFNYFNLTSSLSGSRTLASTGTIGVAGTFTPGVLNSYTITGSTINYNGTGSQTITVFNYFNLASSSTGARTIASGSTAGVAGSFTPGTNIWTVTGSTIDYNGSGSQNIALFNHHNITLSNAGTKTFQGGITGIAGSLSVAGSATADALSLSSTVNFNGTVAQSVYCITYFNLTISGSNFKNLVCPLTINGDLLLSSGTLDVTASNFAITLYGNWTNTGGTFAYRTGTVTLSGPGAQTITSASGENFYNLLVAGSGTKALGGTITVNNDLGINSTLDAGASGNTINLKRNWANNGTFIPQTGTVVLNGSVSQAVGGSSITTFRNLTLNNSAGATITNAQNLTGTLTLTSGTFSTSTHVFTLVSDASGTARIAAIASGANISGNVTAQRYLPGAATDWRMIGSPVSGQTLASWKDDFAMSGFPGSNDPFMSFVSVNTYDETEPGHKDSGWVAPAGITDAITPGRGYFCYIGPLPGTIDVTGPVNKFSISLPVSYTSSLDAFNDGWNLVANPYPSSIDWNAAGWTKTRLNNAIYVWNSSAQQYASYVSGIGTNGGSSIIPSSQAFWVQANAASPSLSLTETVKSATDQAFLRTGGQAGAYTLRLKVAGNNYSDETVVRFDPAATNGFDPDYDAQKLYSFNSNVPGIATVPDSIDYAVNSLPSLTADVSIPVRVLVGVSGSYTISQDLLELPESACIILEDLATGVFTNLRTSSYTFNIPSSTQAPRFVIHIGSPIEKAASNPTCSSSNDGTASATGKGPGPWTYEWKDENNNVIKVATNVAGSDSITGLSAGIYTVTVSGNTGSCGTLTDTVIITAPEPLAIAATPADETCAGASDGAITVNSVDGGSAPYSYNWSGGQTTATVAGLPAGTHTLTITDNNGCTIAETYTITPGTSVSAALTTTSDTVYIVDGAQVNITNTSSGAGWYLWDYADGSTDTSLHASHSYTDAGTYNVMLVAGNGACTDTVYTEIIVMDFPVGIEDASAGMHITLKYTSSGPHLAISLEEASDVELRIFNAIGQQVASVTVNDIQSGDILLPVQGLRAGVYIMQVQAGDRLVSRKFIYGY